MEDVSRHQDWRNAGEKIEKERAQIKIIQDDITMSRDGIIREIKSTIEGYPNIESMYLKQIDDWSYNDAKSFLAELRFLIWKTNKG